MSFNPQLEERDKREGVGQVGQNSPKIQIEVELDPVNQDGVNWLLERLGDACDLVRKIPGFEELDFSKLVVRIVGPEVVTREVEVGLGLLHLPGASSHNRSEQNIIYSSVLEFIYCEDPSPSELLLNVSSLRLGRFWGFCGLCYGLTSHGLATRYPFYHQELARLKNQYRQIVSDSHSFPNEAEELAEKIRHRSLWGCACAISVSAPEVGRIFDDSSQCCHWTRVHAEALMGLVTWLLEEYDPTVETLAGWDKLLQMDRLLMSMSDPTSRFMHLSMKYPALVEAVFKRSGNVIIELESDNLHTIQEVLSFIRNGRNIIFGDKRSDELRIFISLPDPNNQESRTGIQIDRL